MTKKKQRFLINVWYSDWIDADSESEALDIMAERVMGEIKTNEWTYEVQEQDDSLDEEDEDE